MTGLRIEPVTAGDWHDLTDLFGPRGAQSGCWCVYFRVTTAEFSEGNDVNRGRLRRLVEEGWEPGLIAYRDDEPAGWVSVAPREEFGRILRSPTVGPRDDDDGEPVWSIVCFFVPRASRHDGLARLLLAAAVDHAASNGARTVEAYPLDLDVRDRVPSAELYYGALRWFLEAGFTEVERRSEVRPIVRRAV